MRRAQTAEVSAVQLPCASRAAFPQGIPARALPHPAAPVQHQPTPRRARLRRAPGRAGGPPQRVGGKSRAHGGAADRRGCWGGRRRRGGAKRPFNFLSAPCSGWSCLAIRCCLPQACWRPKAISTSGSSCSWPRWVPFWVIRPGMPLANAWGRDYLRGRTRGFHQASPRPRAPLL